ncbi:hypothetical protein DPMN_016721 [Dreissena polymorpha]|uniref:Integrase catalytic domain-containing protein n=2 Tax=Dreissena polymorpha TaxID=45954 RepID=A0A9D4NDW7_DREPO|nr:hypothetical protein DPMN_016721 [Dreissena polymorpha]
MLSNILRNVDSGMGEDDKVAARATIEQIRTNCHRMLGTMQTGLLENIISNLTDVVHQINKSVNAPHDVQDTNNGGFRIRLGARGPPNYQIDQDQLQLLLDRGFTVKRIAEDGLLGSKMHKSTLFRFMRLNRILQPRIALNVSDDVVRDVMSRYIMDHPNSGSAEIRAYLRTREPPMVVNRDRVRAILAELNPVGVATRWAQVVSRRRYSVPEPNSLWHIDSHHSLVRYGIYIHGGIDGNSRLIPYLKAAPYNTARVAFEAFTFGIRSYGIPSRIRVDGGVENVLIKRFMTIANGDGRGSAIEGKSVHNQRIERLWRDVFQKVVFTFYQCLHALEDSGALNLDDPKHIFCAQAVVLARLNHSLECWRRARNNQAIRTEHNQTPEQLWISRLVPALQQSDSTAVRNIRTDRDIPA